MDRICNELETRGSAIPSFHINAFILKATLKAEWTSEKELEQSETTQTEQGTTQTHDTVNDTATLSQLTERQRKIYEIIKSVTINGTVNAQNLSETLGISLRTTKRDLYVLRDMRLIQFTGSDKTGHWELLRKYTNIIM